MASAQYASAYATAPVVEQTLADLAQRLRVLDASVSSPLLQRWAQQLELPVLQPKPIYVLDDIAADVRRRASAVANEQQLNMLMQQISQGLETPPPQLVQQAPAAAASAPSASAAAAPSGGKPANVTSAQISDMIQQLKNGQITQTQLYSQLSNLYSQPAPAGADAGAASAAAAAASSASSSDRRSMLEQMMQQQQAAASSSSSSSSSAPSSASSSGDASLWNALGLSATGASRASAAAAAANDEPENDAEESMLAHEIKALQFEIARTQNEFIGGRLNQAVSAAQEERLQRELKIREQLDAAHQQRQQAQASYSYDDEDEGGSGDDEGFDSGDEEVLRGDSRYGQSHGSINRPSTAGHSRSLPASNRVRSAPPAGRAGLAASGRQGSQPQLTGSASVKQLTDRMRKWQDKVRSRAAELKAEQESHEVDGCTFAPSINAKSRDLTEGVAQNHRKVFTRSRARAKMTEQEIKRQEEQQFRDSCTFRPSINPKSARIATNVMNRSLDPQDDLNPNGTARLFRRQDPIVATMAECTFAPKVNDLKPGMQTASVYLAQSPFERLHNGTNAIRALSPDGGESPGFGNASPKRRQQQGRGQSSQSALFIREKQMPLSPQSALGGRQQSNSLFASASLEQLKMMTSSSMPDFSIHQKARGVTKANVVEFMARQRAREERKQRNLERIKTYAVSDQGHPQLNRKSLEIAARKAGQTDFLERLQHNIEHLQLKAQEREVQRNHVECTFRPQINLKSKQLPARDVSELSSGDQQRLESKRKILIMAGEERELESATFRPVINHTPVEGFLRIRSDAASYVARIQDRKADLEERAQRLKIEAERRELEECTFAPQTTEVPAFVKRIARSVQLTREPNAAAPVPHELGVGWK